MTLITGLNSLVKFPVYVLCDCSVVSRSSSVSVIPDSVVSLEISVSAVVTNSPEKVVSQVSVMNSVSDVPSVPVTVVCSVDVDSVISVLGLDIVLVSVEMDENSDTVVSGPADSDIVEPEEAIELKLVDSVKSELVDPVIPILDDAVVVSAIDDSVSSEPDDVVEYRVDEAKIVVDSVPPGVDASIASEVVAPSV